MVASHQKKTYHRTFLFLLLAAAFFAGFLFAVLSPLFSDQGNHGPRGFSPDFRNLPSASSEVYEEAVSAVSEADITAALDQLRREFPDGSYWNHMENGEEGGVTETPCVHSLYGEEFCNHYSGGTGSLFPQYDPMCQCLGFASLFSDRLFGEDAPLSVHRDFDALRPGDHIRLTGACHSVIVVEKTDDGVTVAEVNRDYETCEISWGRYVSREELLSYGEEQEYITRYDEKK